ncbi:MAG: PHB depolymerase family esterase [Alcaligenaceae bacterium]|nr:PHB depolymerase family esterase [Alcaligenaceae bacterium]
MTNNARSTLSTIVEKSKNAFKTIKQLLSGKSKSEPIDTALPLPDDSSRGEWKKHIFIAPAFNKPQLVTKLDYYIYTPAPTDERPNTKGMPLVVMLHGCTQNAQVFAEGTKMNLLAQQEGFVVVYPQQGVSHNIGKCWRWFDLNESQGLAEAHSIMKIIQSTIIMHELDPEKVFVAGMSAGAGMASVIAAYYPEEIRAVALHSGPVLGKSKDMKSGLALMKNAFNDTDEDLMSYLRGFAQPKSLQLPAIIIQGMEDEVVHIDNTTALSKQFLYFNHLPLDTKAATTKHLSGTAQEYTQSEYKDDKQSVLEVIKIKHLAHAWSGGDEKHPFNSNNGPMATRMIWDFFKKIDRSL